MSVAILLKQIPTKEEEDKMDKQILVPVSTNDRVKELIPFVERVAQPGMKVVFLFRFPVDGFQEYIRAGMATDETSKPKPAEVRRIAERYSLEGQQRLAMRRVHSASNLLREKGIEVSVTVYSGNLKQVLKDYASKNDIHMIVQPAGFGHLISRSLKNLTSAFHYSKQPRLFSTQSLVANCWPM